MTEPEAVELADLVPMRTEIGNCIAAFSMVESMLSLLYGNLMHPAPPRLCYLTLDEARHIESKCRIIKAVGQLVLAADDLPRFKNIMKRVQHKAAVRHKIAHWHVGHWHKNQPVSGVKEMREMEPRLMPAYFSAKNLDFSPDETLVISDLKDFATGSAKLANDILEFASKIPSAVNGGA
ncbi:hypothetical protein FE844_004495 [Rhizobium indicum]|uniref:hypothetical protein n=1 Tax=Rhizobium indicum TaxID=2583231 RepID=UPI0011064E5C|nr:hypothetical protein [Rhizobium indicum]QKK28878.1 hypothetical protein FE844_004495 [Rhizobium indicum]